VIFLSPIFRGILNMLFHRLKDYGGWIIIQWNSHKRINSVLHLWLGNQNLWRRKYLNGHVLNSK